MNGASNESSRTLAVEAFASCLMNIRIEFQNRGLVKDAIRKAVPERADEIEFILKEYYETIRKFDLKENPSAIVEPVDFDVIIRNNQRFLEILSEALSNEIKKLPSRNQL